MTDMLLNTGCANYIVECNSSVKINRKFLFCKGLYVFIIPQVVEKSKITRASGLLNAQDSLTASIRISAARLIPASA